MAKVIAEFERPRYAVEAWNSAYAKWEQVSTDDNVFNAKTFAEKYTRKHDVRTHVLDRKGE